MDILRANGTTELCILKCTSAYPAPPEEANLKTIPNIAETFGCLSGLSDHTTGTEVPVASVALGASFIEKHFKLRDDSGSADDAFSLNPAKFKEMVSAIRVVEKALGRVKYAKSATEKKSSKLQRSLFVCRDMKRGETFTPENVRSIRPGHGLHTRHHDAVWGKQCARDVTHATPMSWGLVTSAPTSASAPASSTSPSPPESRCEHVRLRPATEADMGTLWVWANDPDTRDNSCHSEPIPYATHQAWFRASGADHRAIFMVEWDKEPVGVVRLDDTDAAEPVVSIQVAPAMRGRGVASVALKTLVDQTRKEGVCKGLEAHIKPGNTASQRLFLRAGFTRKEGGQAFHLSLKQGIFF